MAAKAVIIIITFNVMLPSGESPARDGKNALRITRPCISLIHATLHFSSSIPLQFVLLSHTNRGSSVSFEYLTSLLKHLKQSVFVFVHPLRCVHTISGYSSLYILQFYNSLQKSVIAFSWFDTFPCYYNLPFFLPNTRVYCLNSWQSHFTYCPCFTTMSVLPRRFSLTSL